ncbi:hypothetical protein [Jannaschia sp. LMIT008]|uniref:hypothetical protein n=1 Tax=Jannaschia maritima TaxID=3032585 RepID=UPI002811F45D|nr:hypothetical protein [Jannaschia sp. LMIT008]
MAGVSRFGLGTIAFAAALTPGLASAFSILPPSRAMSFVDTPFFGPGTRNGGLAAPDPLSGLTFGLDDPAAIEPCGVVPVPADIRRWDVDLPVGTLVEFARADNGAGLGWLYEYAAEAASGAADPLNRVAVRIPDARDESRSIWRTAPVEMEVDPARLDAVAGLFDGMQILIGSSGADTFADFVPVRMASPSGVGSLDDVADGSAFAMPGVMGGSLDEAVEPASFVAQPRWNLTIDVPPPSGVGSDSVWIYPSEAAGSTYDVDVKGPIVLLAATVLSDVVVAEPDCPDVLSDVVLADLATGEPVALLPIPGELAAFEVPPRDTFVRTASTTPGGTTNRRSGGTTGGGPTGGGGGGGGGIVEFDDDDNVTVPLPIPLPGALALYLAALGLGGAAYLRARSVSA